MAISEPDVRAAGFRLLLAEGRPVTIDELATALCSDADTVGSLVATLDGRGWIRRDADGRLIGSAGLSVVAWRHEMHVGERLFWTWCAYDALGILGALEADGTVISTSPSTGARIEIPFRAGRPLRHDLALFLAQLWDCASVEEEYCPLVNFFETADEATAWAEKKGRSGEVLSVDEATDRGAAEWRPFLTHGAGNQLLAPTDGDCC